MRLVRGKGIKPLIARRGTEHGSGLGIHRWVIEQTFALLHWFRRLRIRREIRDDIHEATACGFPRPAPWFVYGNCPLNVRGVVRVVHLVDENAKGRGEMLAIPQPHVAGERHLAMALRGNDIAEMDAQPARQRPGALAGTASRGPQRRRSRLASRR